MRTTLDLNDKLLAKAKAAAAREKSSLTRFIEEALALRLRTRASNRKARNVKLAVFGGKGGLVAGVDPTSNRSLFDAADGRT